MAASAVASALESEALRVNGRYIDEVVLGWGLCPWAERALRDGQVRRRVIFDNVAVPGPVLTFLDELAADPALAIGFAIFPRLAVTASAFDAFAERVRRADRARGPSTFLVASFHPFAATSFATAAQLVSFVRRTPDPTLQLVRASLLARLPRGTSDEVGRQNFATVAARGAEALDALLRDIRRDRDESYGQPATTRNGQP